MRADFRFPLGRTPVEPAEPAAPGAQPVGLDWVLRFSPNLVDGHPDQARFREMISHENVSLGEILGWLEEAARGQTPQHQLAFQDLVNALVKTAGAEIEFGAYQKDPSLPPYPFDGLWSLGGATFAVTILSQPGQAPDWGTLAAGLETFQQNFDLQPGQLGMVVVLGQGADPEVENSLLASGYASFVRLLCLETLLEVVDMLRHQLLAAEELAAVLSPRRMLYTEDLLGFVQGFLGGGGLPAAAPVASAPTAAPAAAPPPPAPPSEPAPAPGEVPFSAIGSAVIEAPTAPPMAVPPAAPEAPPAAPPLAPPAAPEAAPPLPQESEEDLAPEPQTLSMALREDDELEDPLGAVFPGAQAAVQESPASSFPDFDAGPVASGYADPRTPEPAAAPEMSPPAFEPAAAPELAPPAYPEPPAAAPAYPEPPGAPPAYETPAPAPAYPEAPAAPEPFPEYPAPPAAGFPGESQPPAPPEAPFGAPADGAGALDFSDVGGFPQSPSGPPPGTPDMTGDLDFSGVGETDISGFDGASFDGSFDPPGFEDEVTELAPADTGFGGAGSQPGFPTPEGFQAGSAPGAFGFEEGGDGLSALRNKAQEAPVGVDQPGYPPAGDSFLPEGGFGPEPSFGGNAAFPGSVPPEPSGGGFGGQDFTGGEQVDPFEASSPSAPPMAPPPAAPAPPPPGAGPEATIAALEQQVAMSPHDLGALVQLGHAYREAGRLQEALVPIKKVVKEATDHVQANLAMGRIYFEMKEYPKAALSFEVVLNKERSNVQARIALGDVYSAQEKHSRALKAYQKAAEESGGQNPEVHVRLARSLGAMGRGAEALPYLQQALEMDRNNVEVYLELGNHYLDAKQPGQALEVFQQGLQIDPDNIKLRTYVENLS